MNVSVKLLMLVTICCPGKIFGTQKEVVLTSRLAEALCTHYNGGATTGIRRKVEPLKKHLPNFDKGCFGYEQSCPAEYIFEWKQQYCGRSKYLPGRIQGPIPKNREVVIKTGNQGALTAEKSFSINDKDLNILLQGIFDVKIQGSPGFLCVFGPDAFPIFAGQHEVHGVYHPIAAGGRLGRGKILGSTQDGFLEPETPPPSGYSGKNIFIINGIHWAAKSNVSLKVALIRNKADPLVDFLQSKSLPTTRIPLSDLKSADQLREFDVVLVKEFFNRDKSPIFTHYAESGGGLLVSLTNWAYSYFVTVPGHFGENFAPNIVSSPAGFVWRGDETTATPTTAADSFSSLRSFLIDSHVLDAWKGIKDVLNTGLLDRGITQYTSILEHAFTNIPRDDRFWVGDLYVHAKNYTRVIGQPIPSENHPVTEKKEKFLLKIYHSLSEFVLKPEDMSAHPGSKIFPGDVIPEMGREADTQEIFLRHKKPRWFQEFARESSGNVWDYVPRSKVICKGADPYRSFGGNLLDMDENFNFSNKLPLWFSTGLYAVAGKVIEVTLNSEENLDSYGVQIGTHTDDNSGLNEWYRSPRLVLKMNLENNSAKMSSPYGGLIYILVPESKMSVEETNISVTVRGSLRAPLFRLGTTKKHEWKKDIRRYPGPWAELETKNIILSAPSYFIRDIEDPEGLLLFWDEVLDAMADLAAMPRERYRQERIVPDVQIYVGYMHSGYPIMTLLNEGKVAVNEHLMRTQGSWGHFHELGHNHQHDDWTFSGTEEVTNNIFVLYVFNTVCGIPTSQTHENMHPDNYKAFISKYISGGVKFDQWKDDPWIALMLYVQLQREYGWGAYKDVFAKYRHLEDKDRPKNDQEKMDLWFIKFSQVVEQNLASFFDSWGFPLSKEAKKAVEGYPETLIRILDLLKD